MVETPDIIRYYNKKNQSIELYYSCYVTYLVEPTFDHWRLYGSCKPFFRVVECEHEYYLKHTLNDFCEILEVTNWAELSIICFQSEYLNYQDLSAITQAFLLELKSNSNLNSQIYYPLD